MHFGKVKTYSNTKGSGIIIEEGSRLEFYFHISGLKDEVRQEDSVTFEIERARKGPIAVDVTLAK